MPGVSVRGVHVRATRPESEQVVGMPIEVSTRPASAGDALGRECNSHGPMGIPGCVGCTWEGIRPDEVRPPHDETSVAQVTRRRGIDTQFPAQFSGSRKVGDCARFDRFSADNSHEEADSLQWRSPDKRATRSRSSPRFESGLEHTPAV